MSPLVSIIIPVYKATHTLPECVAQLRAQTYRPLQLIFIDDCSPDDSLRYLEEQRAMISEEGLEVTILHHETNAGVAVARNTGLEAAKGDYIYSVDADDLVAPEAVELMVSAAEQHQLDLVGCEYLLRQGASHRHLAQPSISSPMEAFEQICYGKMKWNLWLFLIRRRLIEEGQSIRFLPGENMGEDLMFMGKLLHRARRMIILHKALYTYVRSEGQITNAYHSEHWTQVEANVRELEAYLHATSSGDRRELLHFLKLNLKLPLLLSDSTEDFKKWRGMYAASNAYIFRNTELSLRTKLLQYAALHGQYWLLRLYNKVVMQWLYPIIYK
ncbi:glycosyltransferase family 2 protein [Porphyromonas sp.]